MADNARRFLASYGNSYNIVGVDGNGRAAIEWGIYHVPDTFIVGREGAIVYKMVGPVTSENIDAVLQGRDRQGAGKVAPIATVGIFAIPTIIRNFPRNLDWINLARSLSPESLFSRKALGRIDARQTLESGSR